MTLVRYNPNYDSLAPSFGWLDKFFNNSLEHQTEPLSFVPNVDILENEKNFELHVAVPGMKKDDFNLELSENLLIISGERKHKEEKKEGNYYSFETQYGSFKRSFRLPKNVDQSKIDAKYTDGILTLVLPKSKELTSKSTIKIK